MTSTVSRLYSLDNNLAAIATEITALQTITANLDATELGYLNGTTAGTTVASKALVVGSNKNVDTLVIADGGLYLGAGAGTAVTSSAAELNLVDGVLSTTSELDQKALSFRIPDGTAEATYWLVSPYTGNITKIYTVTDGAVATADITVTAKIGATGLTNGVVTIATAASAAGDVDVASPSAANAITAGAAMNFVVTGGGAGGTPAITVTVLFQIT